MTKQQELDRIKNLIKRTLESGRTYNERSGTEILASRIMGTLMSAGVKLTK